MCIRDIHRVEALRITAQRLGEKPAVGLASKSGNLTALAFRMADARIALGLDYIREIVRCSDMTRDFSVAGGTFLKQTRCPAAFLQAAGHRVFSLTAFGPGARKACTENLTYFFASYSFLLRTACTMGSPVS